MQIYVWTVNDEEEMKRCVSWELDGIYTNKPAELKKVISRFQITSAK
jgi:glycerophosphoryl diester phosphodiesterase